MTDIRTRSVLSNPDRSPHRWAHVSPCGALHTCGVCLDTWEGLPRPDDRGVFVNGAWMRQHAHTHRHTHTHRSERRLTGSVVGSRHPRAGADRDLATSCAPERRARHSRPSPRGMRRHRDPPMPRRRPRRRRTPGIETSRRATSAAGARPLPAARPGTCIRMAPRRPIRRTRTQTSPFAVPDPPRDRPFRADRRDEQPRVPRDAGPHQRRRSGVARPHDQGV